MPDPLPATMHPDMPTADEAVAHTLLNCLVREVSAAEHQTSVVGGSLLVRLPRAGALLSVAIRRRSLLGAHRFAGQVRAHTPDGGWEPVSWERLAHLVEAELSLRSGGSNDEFVAQVRSSHHGVATGLAAHSAPATPSPATSARPSDMSIAAYLRSEQSLLFGHRFHPTPKARGGDDRSWADYAPEVGAAFRLRHLAVREDVVVEDLASPGGAAPLDRLRPEGVPDGYRFLPAHPWQWRLLHGRAGLDAALDRGEILDLGPGGPPVHPTASVRTVFEGQGFLKFSLDVRITNCVRKNAHYELAGAVALTRRLRPLVADLGTRFPGTSILLEPAFRSAAPTGFPDGLEGLGVIVRDGLGHLRPGLTPVLAAALADEHPTGPAHVSRLLTARDPDGVVAWWRRYLTLLVPPVLAAYVDHGVVLEPHLQNVVVAVDADGVPSQMLLRDLEGTKLLAEHEANAAFLADLPGEVADPMSYDARRGWDRVVYCLVVNHLAEVLAALADLHPHAEATLWREVRAALSAYAAEHGCPPPLRALLAGVPLPAKANLLTRWQRQPDREAGYVPLASPLASPLGEAFLAGAPATITEQPALAEVSR